MAVASTKSKKTAVPKALDIFVWQGVNRKGKKISGELPAPSLMALKAQLRKQGITPGKVKKKAKELLKKKGKALFKKFF